MILKKIKTAQVEARRLNSQVEAALLTTLIGEAEMVGKNAGNRAVTDSEVTAVVKKFLKNIDETLAVFKGNTDPRVEKYQVEKAILETYLPKQLTRDELLVAVKSIQEAGATDMGKIMAELKRLYDGRYDGKMASLVVREVLA